MPISDALYIFYVGLIFGFGLFMSNYILRGIIRVIRYRLHRQMQRNDVCDVTIIKEE